jgi:hypothetical protein
MTRIIQAVAENQVWQGLQARSKAGKRIALAGAFTLSAFVCRTGYYIYHFYRSGPFTHL